MKWLLVSVALLLTATSAAAQAADPVAALDEGDRLTPIELQDQHGESRRLDESARRVIFTREMKAGRAAKAALAEDGSALLEAAGGVYVSDVSRMPRIVRSLFAMPSLRRRPYPILLDFEGRTTATLPSRDGKVTVLTLDGLRVTDVRFLETAEEIRQALAP